MLISKETDIKTFINNTLEAKEKHIIIPKTARYYTMGEITDNVNEVVFVLHGYAMLAQYFIKKFEPVVTINRIVVAPEGLSKFYWEGMSGKVVASWMTKEDRLNEIKDQTNFLDLVYNQITAGLGEKPSITLIGFSQGVATACRWLHHSKDLKVNKLILWAGGIPMEVFEEPTSNIFTTETHFIYGDMDPYIKSEEVKQTIKKLNEKNFFMNVKIIEGKHDIINEGLAYIFD